MKKNTEPDIEKLRNRKGAQRMADVPRDVMDALNRGLLETVSLTEWLAVDKETLLTNALRDTGMEKYTGEIIAKFAGADGGTMRRHYLAGKLLHETPSKKDRDKIFGEFATHSSDVVREWANLMIAADETMPLDTRLEMTRPFAADGSMAVREIAWMSYRPYVIKSPDVGLPILERWACDDDANIRRCAVEGTRPRGVWTSHFTAMKENPAMGLGILDPVKADASRYVQNAVANWLNDASKSQPEWTLELCRRWEKESPAKETAYIIKRATRTINKKG